MASPLPERDCRRPMWKRKAKGISKEQATAIVKQEAERVSDKDIENVLAKSEEIRKRFETGGPLGKFVEDFKLLIAVVKDYRRGKYRKIPFWTVAAIVGALLYVLNPLDLIPDFLPLVGQIDDAAVIAACLLMVRQDLHKYKKWKIENPE